HPAALLQGALAREREPEVLFYPRREVGEPEAPAQQERRTQVPLRLGVLAKEDAEHRRIDSGAQLVAPIPRALERLRRAQKSLGGPHATAAPGRPPREDLRRVRRDHRDASQLLRRAAERLEERRRVIRGEASPVEPQEHARRADQLPRRRRRTRK